MKGKLAVVLAAGVATALVSGCGGDDNTSSMMPTPPPTSQAQALDTAQVLALAKEVSETSSPFAVNAGAVTLTDTSETSDPVSVNVM
jgi:uncharacterized lipoprotein YajG